MSISPGLAATSAHGAALESVTESDHDIRTSAGTCDCALVHPSGAASWPGVVLFPDAFGLRPTLRQMARRLAIAGYTVLVPNPFYRSARAPGLPPGFDFSNAEHRRAHDALRDALTHDAVGSDVRALATFLDAVPAVRRTAPLGLVGYCMGGRMMVQAASALGTRVGAGASFHGGEIVTDRPDSPHLLVPGLRGEYYFGVASDDDAREPGARRTLAVAFEQARLRAGVEVYEGSIHGWCITDLPPKDGEPRYDERHAERAWRELLGLFERALV